MFTGSDKMTEFKLKFSHIIVLALEMLFLQDFSRVLLLFVQNTRYYFLFVNRKFNLLIVA